MTGCSRAHSAPRTGTNPLFTRLMRANPLLSIKDCLWSWTHIEWIFTVCFTVPFSPMHAFLRLLQGGDRRSIGAVPRVIDRVNADPSLFSLLLEGMADPDPLVSMRCADAVEKLTLRHAEWLAPYKNRLLTLASIAERPELRWHMAQLLGRIALTKGERRRVVDVLNQYLDDASRIVKTFSMQTLADIAAEDRDLRDIIVERIEALTRTGSRAMRSRGRKLLARLKPLAELRRAGHSVRRECSAGLVPRSPQE
jgi:hypothetical protein